MIKGATVKKNNAYAFGVFVLMSVAILLPNITFAQTSPSTTNTSGLNPIATVLQRCTMGGTEPCGWVDLIQLANAMVQYGITLIGFSLVLVLIYTGFLYLTSGGDTSKVKKARDMLNKVMWGTIYTLCGWIIVYFIIKQLGVDPVFYNKIIQP